ncbi:MAG: hypothetical protein ACUVSQ_10345 [Pseudanabaenaceae cyanobacterium]
MQHFQEEWILEWCQDNGWTDLFMERPPNYWAFPPNAVMPEPIPVTVLRTIKAQKGLSQDERFWAIAAVTTAAIGALGSVLWQCPLPLVVAFAFCALAVARLEVEFA